MKEQSDGPLPRQLSHKKTSCWGVGLAGGFGKRCSSGSDQHVPLKLQKVVGPEPEDRSFPDLPHASKSHRGGLHVQDVSGEDRDDPVGRCFSHEPQPKGSVPHTANGFLLSNRNEPGNTGFQELVPSSSNQVGASESGTNRQPCKTNIPASPACSSFTHNILESCGEDQGSSEPKFWHDTAVASSGDVDRLHRDSDGKVPEATIDWEVSCVTREKLEMDIKEYSCRNKHFIPLKPELQMLNSMSCESMGEKYVYEEFDTGSVHGVDDDYGDETQQVPKETRQCLFAGEMPPEEQYVMNLYSCTVAENAPTEFPFANESAVGGEIAEQKIESMQDFCAPGSTSLEMAVGSDDEVDGRSVDSYNSDVPDDEIEAMLEEGLLRKPENKGETMVQFNQREKIVLDELGHDHFDVLPEGWVKVTHNSGMPVYLHKASRVCNVTKPYFLGPGSARKHEIPLSAIPCLQYRRALDEEQATMDSATVTVGPGGIQLPNACIETAEENKARHSLSADQVHEYCRKRFSAKMITVTRTKGHSGKTATRDSKQISRPTLPEGTKLIKFPVENKRPVLNNTRKRKEWILNPNGKSYVCILHEYVQHALKKQPSYIFKETEQPGRPYSASVLIDQVQYGVGCGSSKKHAKSEAAKQTLEILIPEMRDKIEEDRRAGHCKASSSCNTDLSIFDEIRIEDPRVAELCAKTTEPSPYAILLTCLQRNLGLGELDISCEVRAVRHLNIEYVMTVGKHTAVVMCKNKRDGKQRTSQAVLQKMHPRIKSWGSILRMYGSSSIKSMKDKKQEEQEITFLQSKAEENEPNYAILCKLEETMFKLATEYKNIGKFIPPSDEKLPSSSGADLNTVNM